MIAARHATLLAMLAGAAMIVAPGWSRPDIRLIWNASASVPLGLYRVVPAGRIAIAGLVVIMPPDPIARFLDERHYLPRGLPIIKRVLALGGDTVCRSGANITINGIVYGRARTHDTRGRSLPVWQGCRTLGGDDAFVMNRDAPDSFDSRYFGPLPVTTIVGRAVPLWTNDDSDAAADAHHKPGTDAP